MRTCMTRPATKIALRSIGCRTNQEEMSSLGRSLAQNGHRVVEHERDAEIVVVNTCAVTSHTEAKTRHMLRSIRRRAPRARILVTGCLAQQKPDHLRAFQGVAWVVGNAHKQAIASILNAHEDGTFHGPLSREVPLGIAEPEIAGCGAPMRTRFAVKIQEGCDNACSYCIVPRLRGPSRSASSGDIRSACERAAHAGYREIILTGTHIGQYRDDASGHGLVDLLADILRDAPRDFRIRLSSLNPRDVSNELLALMNTDSRICEHLHISTQALCPGILAAMHRDPGDVERLFARLARFRARHPLMGLGADFIVGFPGETESMFGETLARAAEIGFSYGHVFRYSRRPGTIATSYGSQVDECTKRERSERLRDALAESRRGFARRLRGTRHTVLVESSGPPAGLASNYMRVEVPGANARPNAWCTAEITGFDAVRSRCVGTEVS
ncbi:MAG: MiaB/RimO family radical SAM methylthiotransferase [Chitinivibrionales bacterium]|nr:MiaB/RimO family radical SAM methylthiotransferase [Chitinivibrionales bacterium]